MGSDQGQATRQSWKTLPLPEQHARLDLRREFTLQEYERLCYGLIPEQMEDKWFIFLEEDTLYFHRSWTGSCIFQVWLIRQGEGYTVAEALVNRDPSQYGGTDERNDARMLTFLIDNLLLRRPALLPTPATLPAGIQTELYHHHVAGGQRASTSPESSKKRACLWGWLRRG